MLRKQALGVVIIVSLLGLLACSGAPAAPQGSGAPSAEIAALQGQVAGQATRIAILETKVAASQPQAKPAASAPPATPTIVPPVAGLPADGAAKGAATAKVTITEYTNYF